MTDNPTSEMNDELIKSIFEYAIKERLYTLSQSGCSLNILKNKVTKWRNEGSIIVFTAGVFDILHVNHLLALTHYRLLGAKEYTNRTGLSIYLNSHLFGIKILYIALPRD